MTGCEAFERLTRTPSWKAEAAELLPGSSGPMQGGLGRARRFRAAMEALPSSERVSFARAVDEMCRPMIAREIEEALLDTGLTRSDRKRLVNALKGFNLVLIDRR